MPAEAEFQALINVHLSRPGVSPVLDAPLPDPYVYRDGVEWYIFGTGAFFYHGRELEPAAMRRGDLELDYNGARRPQGIWGFVPDLGADGAYHAHATLHYGQFRTVIAHFVPAPGEAWRGGAAITRWRLGGVLVGDLENRRDTFYESKLVRDGSGELYLVYSGSPARHSDVSILAQRMIDPGRVDPSVAPRPLLRPEGFRSEDRNPGYIQIVEGANIVQLGSKYVLLYSVGDFARNNYKLGVAYSDRLIPREGETYEKPLISDPANVWANKGRLQEVCYLLQSERREWLNYCRRFVSGPGLGNIVKVAGQYRLVFHGYRPNDPVRNPRNRYVWSTPLEIDFSDERPRGGWLRVRIERDSSAAPGESAVSPLSTPC